MSKKKMQVDAIDLDSSLEFNDFDMGFPSIGDDRKPVSKPGQAFVKGVGSGLTDKALIEDLMKKNLPREYGSSFDMLSEVASGAKNFTADMVKETKPIIGNLANAAEKVIPASFKTTKEKLSKIRSWAEEEHGNGAMSKEQQREANLGVELGRVFQQQAQTQAINEKISKKEKDFDRGIGMAQHKDILSVLVKMSNNAERVAGYTTTINSAWQRKTLETQYHQLFVLQDILEESKKSNADVINNLTAIVKNSALPEYRKTQKDEAFLDEARKRFSGKIVDASSNFFAKGLKKMKADIGSTVGDLASVTSILSTMADMHQMGQEMDPKTTSEMLAGASGNKLGKWVTAKVGGKLIDKAKTNPDFVKKVVKGQNFVKSLQTDGPGLFKEYLKRQEEKDGGEGGLMSMLASWLNNSFEHDKPNHQLAAYDSKSMYNASPFTNKVSHSITDVIPGYLARILQEQTSMRTGNNASLIKYDYRSGDFKTSKDIVDSIKKSISSEELSKSSDIYFRDNMAKIEETTQLNDDERSLIAKIHLKKASEDSSLDPEKLTDPDHWKEQGLPADLAEKMAVFYENLFGTKSNKEFYDPRNDNIQGKAAANKFNANTKELKYLNRSKRDEAQFLLDHGMKDEARKAGLINSDDSYNHDLITTNTTKLKGSYRGRGETGVDVLKEYAESRTDLAGQEDNIAEGLYQASKAAFKSKRNEGIGDSDVNIKDHISKTGDVLGPISRLPIGEWQYKPGHGDSGETKNIGPMAQDVKKQFGDEVAPGGTTIDLVNSNGIAFKAIQELNNKFDKFKDFFKNKTPNSKAQDPSDIEEGASSPLPQDVLSCLRGIYYNTSEMVKQGSININLSTEGIKNMAAAFGQQLGKLDLSGTSDKIKTSYDKASSFVKNNSASSILGKIGDFISNNAGSALTNGIQRGKSIIKGGFSGAKSIMDSVSNKAGSMFDHAKMKALETFDVYMPGEKEPRMVNVKMRQGYYIDFKKQVPVKTRKDVREAVGGITEVQSDGSTEMVLQGSELSEAIFVNTHKSLIERVLKGAVGTATGTVKGVFNNILKPGFLSARNIMSGAKSLALKILDAPIDVYLKSDPSKCVLLAKVMREGGYKDQQDGTTIERPTQIKGAVFDVAKNEIAVSVDDYRDGLVDINGKAIGFSAARKIAGAVVGAGASIMSYTLNKITKAPGILGKLAKKGTDMMKNLANKLGIPSFTLGNFFGTQAVDILKDIKDILLYQAGLADKPKIAGIKENLKTTVSNTVKATIGKAKFKKAVAPGLEPAGETILAPKENVNDVDPNREVSTTEVKSSSGLGSMLMKGVGGAASLIGSFFKKKRGLGKGGLGSDDSSKDEPEKSEQDDEQNNKLSKLTKTLKSFKDKANGKKDQAVDAIKRAKTIAKDGIARTADGLKVGSWQERAKNAINKNKEIIRDKADVKVYATKNIFAMIADLTKTVGKKLKDWFSKGGNPAETAGDIADAAGGNGKGRRGGGGKWGKAAGVLGKVATGAGALYAGNAAIDDFKAGNYGTAALEGAGAAGLAAHTYGGMSSVKALGKGAMKVGGKLLGPAALAYGAYSAYDNVQKGNYGEAALDAGLTLGGGALMYGGLGATAGAIGTGALAVGGTALAIITSPVTLTALAIAGAAAGIGYGGYKAYQYLTRKEFNPTEMMRFLEYGLRGGDKDNMRTIHELELYLEEVSTTKDESLEIDGKKFDLKKALAIFDIDDKDQERTTAFMKWFEGRFKQIFGKWKLLIKAIDNQDKISWLEKAPDPKLLEIYKGFKPYISAYSVSESPFKEIKLNTDYSVIENYKLEWIESLKLSTMKSKDKETEKAVTAAGKKEVADRKSGDKAPGSEALPATTTTSGLTSAKDSYDPKNIPQDGVKKNQKGFFGGVMQGFTDYLGITSSDEPEDKSVGDKSAGAPVTPKKASTGGATSVPGATGELLPGSGANKFLSMGKDVNINGLHPSVKRLFLGAVEEYGQITGKNVQVNRAFSSTAEQEALYKRFGPGKAAKPGTSLHEFGLAIDVQSSDLDAMDKLGLLRKYGLTRPLGSEPWHLEPAGIFDNGVRQKAKTNPSFAESYIEAGVGRGGGGLGSRGRGGDLARDDSYAKMLFDSASTAVAAKKEDAPPPPSKAIDGTKDGAKALASAPKPGAPDATGITDKEPKGGKVPSSGAGGSSSKESVQETITAANDKTMQSSKEIAQGSSKGGSYLSLPESKGDGWENNKDMILASAKMVGIDPALAAAIAAKESSLKPGARGVNSASGNSTAKGLFQFMPATWDEMISKHGAKYGIAPGTSPMDARANVILGMEYLKSSMNKGDGSPQQTYMGHMLGATGLGRLKSLKDDEVVAKSFQSQAANNPNVFYADGDTSKPYTKQQLLTKVSDSLNKNLKAFNIPLSIKAGEAANDSFADKVKAAEQKYSSKLSPQDVIKKGNPSEMMETSFKAVEVEDNSKQQNPMAAMANQAPVITSSRTAPVVDNSNNGIVRIEKISGDQLQEQKITNTILNDIKELLTRSIKEGGGKTPEAPVEAPKREMETVAKTVKPVNEPVSLPQSYVQRRRAA